MSYSSRRIQLISILEPETSAEPTTSADSVINQDGWLNALSLDKLTTTVGYDHYERINSFDI